MSTKNTSAAVKSELVQPLVDCRQSLYASIREYETGGGAPYVVEMWRYALAEHGQDDSRASQNNERCDALPYLPVDVSDYGVELTGDSSILDVGCLGGYGLYDIAERFEAKGQPIPRMVGVDIDPASIALSEKLAEIWGQGRDVSFRVSRAEDLSTELGSFDVIVSRLVLPYTDVRTALAAISRVLKDGGILLLQIHAPRYYLTRVCDAWPSVKRTVYYLRPLLSWFVFNTTGYQFRSRRLRETALTFGLLNRLCQREGFVFKEHAGFAAKPIGVYKAGRSV